MPQFDVIEFANIYLWFFFIFVYFYMFWANYIIPQLFKVQVLRKFIAINNNILFLKNKSIFICSKNIIVELIIDYNYNYFRFIKNDF